MFNTLALLGRFGVLRSVPFGCAESVEGRHLSRFGWQTMDALLIDARAMDARAIDARATDARA